MTTFMLTFLRPYWWDLKSVQFQICASLHVMLPSCAQPSYTPTAMNYDFALITVKSAANAAAGYLGMTVGTSSVTLNLTTAGYPVSPSPLPMPPTYGSVPLALLLCEQMHAWKWS